MTPGRRSAALALLAALAVACGGPAPTAAPPSGFGPAFVCALVPNLDDIVGRAAVAPPSGYTTGRLDRCLWVYGADPTRSVGLTVGPRAGHDETIEAFGEGERVPGAGDDARWWPGPRTLSVVTADRSFQVDVQLGEMDDPKGIAYTVALTVLENLP